MKYSLLIFLIFISVVLISCSKAGQPEPAGGDLPTNYIIINDASFSPTNIKVVNGSSITFVNRSGSAKGIYSSDSVVINKQNILDNTSYFFKKDTVGTIFFKIAGNPLVVGSITFKL